MRLINYVPGHRLLGLNSILGSTVDSTLDRLFANESQAAHWEPRVDIIETSDHFSIEAELAGLTKKEVSISVHDNELVITGKKSGEDRTENEDYVFSERTFGPFEKRFRLGRNIDRDKIKARFRNGLLTIVLPKAAEARPRNIEVS